ncbi:tetratricopeptide repeat protein [Streptomyces netropsis]|uniref:tetratricopeptide repeat protein n=1 Tax=Streptomyces netropsis TaxID=55404 RepID=UPI0037BA9D19
MVTGAVGKASGAISNAVVANIGFATTGNVFDGVHRSVPLNLDIDRPALVGVLPARASAFQSRHDLRADMERTDFDTLILVGGGGTGKTQLAGDYARHALSTGAVDVLVWITANAHDDVVSGYAQAAVQVLGADPRAPWQAAQVFLAWLVPKAEARPRQWLVVLDDIADPADLRGLWPPSSPHGRTLATTRRRDAVLTGGAHCVIEVGLFTESESVAYLTSALGAHGRTDPASQLAALAAEVGYLPLALSQAAAYLIDAGEEMHAYQARLADRTTALADAAPDVLSDDQAVALAATGSLSLDRADTLRPAGLARPMLQLASFLDPHRTPVNVLTSEPALTHLATHRTATGQDATESPSSVLAEDAVGALRALHRLSLIYHPVDPHELVCVHQLVQRATLDTLDPDQHYAAAHAAADALAAAWPDVERDITLAQTLRVNTTTLTACAGEALFWPKTHPVLFRVGRSLGEAGQVIAARTHFQHLTEATTRYHRPDHPDTLTARSNLAFWRGEAGDAAGATAAFEELLADQLRVLGPDHPDTLTSRANLAASHFRAGHAEAAAALEEHLIADRERVLGPDHPDTLTSRTNLVVSYLESGRVREAITLAKHVVADHERLLGPDHVDTLRARVNLSASYRRAGRIAEAEAVEERLAPDRDRLHNLGLYVFGRVAGSALGEWIAKRKT